MSGTDARRSLPEPVHLVPKVARRRRGHTPEVSATQLRYLSDMDGSRFALGHFPVR
jgi:hypothetical protein